jgi:hypothetical protein
LSSAILYVAIVAIWALVLVPRWLRNRSAAPQSVEPQPARPQESPAGAGPLASEPAYPAASAPDGPATAAGPAEPEPAHLAAPAGLAGAAGPAAPEAAREAPEAPATALRADILRARRRMLAALIALTGGAVALAVAHFAAFWIVIPPTLVLAGFIVLLREAAHIDSERSGRTTRIHHAAANAVAAQEPGSVPGDATASPAAASATAAVPATEPPGADVIDISGRISDQVYDQYADAKERAVGD